VKGAAPLGFSHGDFDRIVQALNHVTGKRFFALN
jgi:hypothetical protein